MTGAAHLFGGEEALLAEVVERLGQARIPACAALADTPGAAWALARFGPPLAVCPPGGTREALADLPVEALRIDEASARLLRRFGLSRIGQLYPLPRSGLARRFRGLEGLTLVRRLDQALGLEGEPLSPVRPPARHFSLKVFAEPLTVVEGVDHWLPDLAGDLAAGLERDGQGARVLRLEAFRVDGGVTALQAGLSAPSRAPAHLVRLLREAGLEKLDLGFGADALRLCAVRFEPLADRQQALRGAGDDRPEPAEALAGLIDRLQARLGPGTARRPVPRESHIPERSEAWPPARPEAAPASAAAPPPRPILLFDPPEPVEAVAELPDHAPARFVWRRVAHRVARAQGPERLAPEWWRLADAEARTRDYYLVEDDQGRRFWLFREGLYERIEGDPDAEPRPPVWRMHGVFA